MIAHDIIVKALKILIPFSGNNDAVQDDNADFVASDESDSLTPQKTPWKQSLEELLWKT